MFVYLVLFLLSFTRGENSKLPKAIHSVGVGYNILYGNPDGTDWRHGGEDPGLLVTKQILSLESELATPNQLAYVHHDSCQMTASDGLIYSPKSYQDFLGQRITFAGTSLPSLQASAFTLSAGYTAVKKETDNLHYVLQDKTNTCILGTGRYTLELVTGNNYHLTDGFIADVCSLPEAYDADKYTHFIDKWGTHVVTGMKIGTRQTIMTVGTRRDYVQAVKQKSPADVTVGGRLYNWDASFVVDVGTFKLRPYFPVTVGSSSYNLATGNSNSPEPVGLDLTSIDVVLTTDFWNDAQYSQNVCPGNITAAIAIRRRNLISSLHQYVANKAADTPQVEKLEIPVVWPSGKIGLPKPKDGCPNPSTSWLEGWLQQTTEKQSPDDSWNATKLDATLSKTNYILKFCMKPYAIEEFSLDWPAGDYCVFMYKQCPNGFSMGYVQWDDDDTDNANAHGGVVPDGSYGRDIRMNYCCRSDGDTYNTITLPTETPFYLFQYKNGCQDVRGMTYSVEYILWDDEDTTSPTSAAIGAVHPGMKFCNPPLYPGCGSASTIYYCYYKKDAHIQTIVG